MDKELEKELRDICSLFGVSLQLTDSPVSYFDKKKCEIILYEFHEDVSIKNALFHELGHLSDYSNGFFKHIYEMPETLSEITDEEIKSFIKDGYNHEVHADETGEQLFKLFFPEETYIRSYVKNNSFSYDKYDGSILDLFREELKNRRRQD